MPIELTCHSCGKRLRVRDEAAGKKARCPGCQTVLDVPAAGGPPSAGGPLGGEFPGINTGAGDGPRGPQETGNPFQSPADVGPEQRPPLLGGGIQPTVIDFADVFNATIEIFKKELGMVVGATLVFGIITNILSQAIAQVGALVEIHPLIVMPFNMVISTVLNAWLLSGLIMVLLPVVRGQQANFGDLFNGGPYFGNMLVTLLILEIAVTAGLALCIVPGIIIALYLWPATLLVVDQKMDFRQALETATKITEGNRLTAFLVFLVGGLIAMASLLLCCVGVIFGSAFSQLLMFVMYVKMIGQPTAAELQQP